LSYQRENTKDLADELGVQVRQIHKYQSVTKTPGKASALITGVAKKNRSVFIKPMVS
jgi:hypothetical protein